MPGFTRFALVDTQLSLLNDDSPPGAGVHPSESRSGSTRAQEKRTGGLRLLPAAYAPDKGRPVCPRCWSTPQVKRYTRGIRGAPRGWSASAVGEFEEVDGRQVGAVESIYRCSNTDCDTAIALRMLVTGGYVPRLVAEHTVSGADAVRFRAGRHRRDGVWLASDGKPRTARAQTELKLL